MSDTTLTPREIALIGARWYAPRISMLLDHLDYLKDNEAVQAAQKALCGDVALDDMEHQEEHVLQLLWEAIVEIKVKDPSIPRKMPRRHRPSESTVPIPPRKPEVPLVRAPAPVIVAAPSTPVANESSTPATNEPNAYIDGESMFLLEEARNAPAEDDFTYKFWDPARLPMLKKRMKRLEQNEEMQEEKEALCGDDEIDLDIEDPAVLQMLWQATEKVMASITRKSGVIWNEPPRKLVPIMSALSEPASPIQKEQARDNMEKPFTCPACAHVFSYSQNLSRHSNVHKGRRYPCSEPGCTYTASDKRYIQSHLRSKHHK